MKFFTQLRFLIFCLSIWSGTVTAQEEEVNFPPGPAENDTKIFNFHIFLESTLGGLLIGGSTLPKEKLLEIQDYQLAQRQGDAYMFNHFKYFINLYGFDLALRGNANNIPYLPLHPRPLDNLRKHCTVQEHGGDIMEDFLAGGLTEEHLVEYPPDIIPCTPAGYMPVLLCLAELEPDPITGKLQRNGTCVCTQENIRSKWTPFVYHGVTDTAAKGTPREKEEISCVAQLGSLCDNTSLPCEEGVECVQAHEKGPSFCGGTIGKLARGFGGSIRFTDKQLADILKSRQFSTQEEVENYLIRVTNSINVHSRDCDPNYWDWVAGQLFKILKSIQKTNATERDLDENMAEEMSEFLGPFDQQLFAYYMSSVIKAMGYLNDDESHLQTDPKFRELTRLRSEYYDLSDYCLNEFPRMACIKKKTDPQRGLCLCASSNETGSRAFNYFLEDGQCVGGVGVVCTTVRGSGDHICAKGLVCEPYANDTFRDIRIPGPSSHLEFHICKYPTGNTGTNGTNNQTAQDQGQTNGSVQISDTSVLFLLHVIAICLIFKNFGIQVLTKLANYQSKSA